MRVAVVLGAAVRADGSPSPTLALRVDHAVALWRAGKVDQICLTGGRGRHGASEASVGRDRALAAGVPASALTMEAASTNTLENIANALAILPADAEFKLISNRWHLPRARMIARLLGRGVRISAPVGKMSAGRLALAILREAAAMPVSVLRTLRRR